MNREIKVQQGACPERSRGIEKSDSKALVPIEVIEDKIFVIRGLKVMLDKDLAFLYGVSTKRLNEQVKRNKNRFPADFMFQLTKEEHVLLESINPKLRSQNGDG